MLLLTCFLGQAQDSTQVYKKRVLESTEVDFLTSYYSQDGDNAAVTGGIGTEELKDVTLAFIIAIPLNDDDVLTIDFGVSAYSSASSSNVDPFDNKNGADAFSASSGASQSDTWVNLTGNYSHSSDDRNEIWSAKVSVSSEYDYFSIGAGGSFTKLFNQKNTELSIHGNVFIDTWNTFYPKELRSFGEGGSGIDDSFFTNRTITGNPNYNPGFNEFTDIGRNTYAVGFGFSQILSKKLQGSLAIDVIAQKGLLSTPFQRVYFADIEGSFIDDFHLANDIERLPNSRLKLAFGGRLNYYINQVFVVRTYARYYSDNWGIQSFTASIELPIKISQRFTIYPSYRFYNQTAADYFAPYDSHHSSDQYYTSDYDLSKFNTNQYGIGVSYTDVFTGMHLGSIGIKSIDVKFNQYSRNSTFRASIISVGVKFVVN